MGRHLAQGIRAGLRCDASPFPVRLPGFSGSLPFSASCFASPSPMFLYSHYPIILYQPVKNRAVFLNQISLRLLKRGFRNKSA